MCKTASLCRVAFVLLFFICGAVDGEVPFGPSITVLRLCGREICTEGSTDNFMLPVVTLGFAAGRPLVKGNHVVANRLKVIGNCFRGSGDFNMGCSLSATSLVNFALSLALRILFCT